MSNTDLAERVNEDLRESVREGGDLVPMSSGVMQIERPSGAIKVEVARDDRAVMQKLKTSAAMGGEDFYYRFPVWNRRENRQDFIEGPSIKCANAVVRAYGNCTIKVRAVDFPDHWIFYAQFCDLETGFTYERAFQQRKGQKTMKTDADRQLDIVFQIGQSKAIRNVIVNALSLFTDYTFAEAKQSFIERIKKDETKYRERIMARLVEYNVDVSRVEAVLGRTHTKWLVPDLARVVAELQSVQDGMATIDETYPPLTKEAEPRPKMDDAQKVDPEQKTDTVVKPQEVAQKVPEQKQAEQKQEPSPKVAQTDAERHAAEFTEWLDAQYADLETVGSMGKLDQLDDDVLKELNGDPAERARWSSAVNARARAIQKGSTSKK